MDKVTTKHHIRTDRAAIYGLPSVEWTPHKDVTRQSTKACSLLSTVVWSQKEMAPLYPVQGYHREKPEAEIH